MSKENEKKDGAAVLLPLLGDEERIAQYNVSGAYTWAYCIIPADRPFAVLDLAACIEDTLHRLLESLADATQEEQERTIWSVLGLASHADKEELSSDDGDGEEIMDIDLGYFLPGPVMQAEPVPYTDIRLEEKIYERYKLLWMIDNGYTARDLFCASADLLINGTGRHLFSLPKEYADEAFHVWENESGFSGNLYWDFETFLEKDYREYDGRFFQNDQEKTEYHRDQCTDADL